MSDMFPPDEPEDVWSDKWERRQDELGYPEDWQEQDLTLYNDVGFPSTESVEYWHELVSTYGAEEIEYMYPGMDNLSIIRDLEEMGLWDAEDWETWRNQYELVAG